MADTEAYKAATRLYVEADLAPGQAVALSSDQGHYLQHVLRRKPGDRLALFNGRDGEWTAEIAELHKGRGVVTALACARAQAPSPDLWLAFAPVKRTRLDFLVQKAVELGVAALIPVLTRFTMVERVKEERLVANAIEAAEQCDRLDVPAVHAPVDLGRMIDGWDPARRLLFCDEGGEAQPLATVLAAAQDVPAGPWALLIGPEGGFHPAERAYLRTLSYVTPVTLGPRILRADTAAIAALALWQSLVGDWR